MAINDALPLKTAQRDAIAKLKSFGGFEFADAVSFRFAIGRQVNAVYSVCDGLGTE